MLQEENPQSYIVSDIRVGDTVFDAVNKFCYLGRIPSFAANIDDDISARLAKASTALGRLPERLWKDHGIRLTTKNCSLQGFCFDHHALRM